MGEMPVPMNIGIPYVRESCPEALASRKLVYREVLSAPWGWLCQRKRDLKSSGFYMVQIAIVTRPAWPVLNDNEGYGGV